MAEVAHPAVDLVVEVVAEEAHHVAEEELHAVAVVVAEEAPEVALVLEPR